MRRHCLPWQISHKLAQHTVNGSCTWTRQPGSDHERYLTQIQNILWETLFRYDFPKFRYSPSNICTHISRCYFQRRNSSRSCTPAFESYHEWFQLHTSKGSERKIVSAKRSQLPKIAHTVNSLWSYMCSLPSNCPGGIVTHSVVRNRWLFCLWSERYVFRRYFEWVQTE